MKNRLRVLRAERDWTQTELARRLGVSTNTVNSIENGKSYPSLPLVFRMIRAFGVRLEKIFTPDEEDLAV